MSSGRSRTRSRSWSGTSPATGIWTWPSLTPTAIRYRCCWAMATARSSPRSTTLVGSSPYAIVAGDFNGDGRTRSGRRQLRHRHRVGPAGQRRWDVPAPGPVHGGRQEPMNLWPGTSMATGGPIWPSPAGAQVGDDALGVGLAGQWGRHLRAPGQLPGRDAVMITRPHWDGHSSAPTFRKGSWPGISPATADLDLAVASRTRMAPAWCRCCWATATAPSRPRSPTRSVRDRSGSWPGISPATATSTWPSPTPATTRCRCCWATATAPSSPRSSTRSGRARPGSWRGTSPATAASTWPSPTDGDWHGVGAAGQRRRHLRPQVTYAVGT